MGILSSSASFTRFRLLDPVPRELWEEIPSKLKQFAMIDIDEIPEERGWGWTNSDDMLDTAWKRSIPEKGNYITFALRLDTRRIPPAVLNKHVLLALRAEEILLKEQGKKFISRDRRKEIKEQVKLRLMQRFLPIPAVFDVVWNTDTRILCLFSTQSKIIDLFMNHFTLTFGLHIEPLTPMGLASSFLSEDAVNRMEVSLRPTAFV